MSPAEAGSVLDSCVRIEMDPKNLNTLDDQTRSSINTLIYLTRAAIVLHCLDLYRQHGVRSERVVAILKEFERHTFSAMPVEGRGWLLEKLQKLTKLTIELEKFANDEKLPTVEISRRTLSWSKDWFGLMFVDEQLQETLCLTHGGPMVFWIGRAMWMLGKTVEALVLGKKLTVEERS